MDNLLKQGCFNIPFLVFEYLVSQISIAFEGITHPSSKTHAQALNRQLTYYFGMQVDSSGLNLYWTIFRSVLCDHFQIRRNIQENFGVYLLFCGMSTSTILWIPHISHLRGGVTVTIGKAGSSSQGTVGLAVHLLYHLREHCLAFLTEVFNLFVGRVDIPAIWKNSFIIPILKAGKPSEPCRSSNAASNHYGGAGYSPLPAWLQTEALHHLGPAPHFC